MQFWSLPPSEAKVYYFCLIYVKFCFPDASKLDEDIFWYIMLTEKTAFIKQQVGWPIVFYSMGKLAR